MIKHNLKVKGQKVYQEAGIRKMFTKFRNWKHKTMKKSFELKIGKQPTLENNSPQSPREKKSVIES